MPGHFTHGHIDQVKAEADRLASRQEPTPAIVIAEDDFTRLFCVIDFSQITTVLDPWPHPSTIAALLGKHVGHVQVFTRAAAMHPKDYRLGSSLAPCIIAAPSQFVLDVVVPLGVKFSDQCAAFLVPITYVTCMHAPAARSEYLANLKDNGRVIVIPSTSVLPGAVQQVWLVIFASKAIKDTLLRDVVYPFVPIP